MNLKTKILVLVTLFASMNAFAAVVEKPHCPDGFTEAPQTTGKKHCCEKRVSCPQGFVFSTSCDSMSGGSGGKVGFCCEKKEVSCRPLPQGCSLVMNAGAMGGTCCQPTTINGVVQCKKSPVADPCGIFHIIEINGKPECCAGPADPIL